MNRIKFGIPGGFPLDQSTLDFLQSAYTEPIKELVKSFGDYVILSGSQGLGGFVAIKGEIMPFVVGSGSLCYVQETASKLVFEDGSSNEVLFSKRLIWGTGTPQLNWNDFKRLPIISDTLLGVVDILQGNLPIGNIAQGIGYEGNKLVKSNLMPLIPIKSGFVSVNKNDVDGKSFIHQVTWSERLLSYRVVLTDFAFKTNLPEHSPDVSNIVLSAYNKNDNGFSILFKATFNKDLINRFAFQWMVFSPDLRAL